MGVYWMIGNSAISIFAFTRLLTDMLERLKYFWSLLQRIVQKKQVRQLIYVGIVLISLVFIAYVVITNWRQLTSQEWRVDPLYAILVVILYPLGMIPTAAAWHWLLRAFNINKPFLLNLRLYALSSLPKHIPGLVWYVTSRSLLYEEYGVSAGVVIGATAAESFIMAASGFISAIFILSLQTDFLGQFSVLRYLSIVSLIALIMLFIWAPGGTRLLVRLLKKWRKDVDIIHFQRSALFICLVWMFLAWMGGGVLLWFLVRAILPIGLELLPVMVGIWGAAGAVSLSIGIGVQGLGLREVTLAALLSLIISPIIALVAAIAFRLLLTLAEFLWVFLIYISTRGKQITQKVS
jgi:hypothetical protein